MLFFFFGLACTAQSDTAPSSGDSALDDPGSDSVPGVDSDDTALGGRHDSSLDTSPPNDTEPPMDCSGGSGWPPGGSLVDVGGGSAYIWVPKSLPPCAPLVFFGHGGSAAGGYVSGEWLGYEGTDLPALADQLGFVLVVPGVEEGPSTTHSWSLSSDTIDWLTALVEAAWGGVDLDRDRVSFIGTSAGGHMAVYLGLYVVSPWTGIGSLSAGLGGYFDYPSPPPEPRLPFFVAHDPEDTIVSYAASEYLVEALEDHDHPVVFEDWERGPDGHLGWPEGIMEAAITTLDGLR